MNYKDYIEKITPKENKYKNIFYAFISGGIIGFLADLLVTIFNNDMMLLVFIISSGIITGFGLFDDLANIFKMGIIIPITGFSHSVVSSSLEYKNEGLITGIGSNYFKLAGSVILYGIVSSTFFSILRWLICLV